MSRTHRAAWSYITNVGYFAVTTAIALVSTPLLLFWLGAERFGAWRAATDWFGYLILLELGLGGSLLPMLARVLSRGEERATEAVLTVGVRAHAWVGLPMLAAGVALTLAITTLVPVQQDLGGELEAGSWLGLLGLLVVPLIPFRLLAEAGQRGYLVNGLLTLQAILTTSLALLLAWQGWGLVGQNLATVAGISIFYLALTADGLWRYPGLLRGVAWSHPSSDIRQELWRLNRPSLMLNICGRVSLLTDNIIIAALLGPTMVVPFFVTQRLAVLGQTILQGIGNATWAALAELHAKEDHATLQRRLVELTSLVTVLGLTGMVPIVAYNRHFVSLWVGASNYGGGWLTLLAAGNGLLQALFSLWGWVFSGTGQVGRIVRMLVAATILNLAASIIATLLFGLPGPLLGTTIAFVSINLWCFPLLLQKVFNCSIGALIRAIAWPFLLALPCAGLAWWVAETHEPWGWLGLAAEMGLTGITYLLLAWWLVFNRDERASWLHRLRIVLPGRSAGRF